MSNVVIDMAMSVDGFISGPRGEDGGLHDYFFSPSAQTAAVVQEGIETTGAIIMGRRCYDTGVAQGGYADDPYQVPTFVLSSSVPGTRPQGAERFVFGSSLPDLLEQAKAAAGDRLVVVGGGARTAQEFLARGLVDELCIHLVPILLGGGTRLFDRVGSERIALTATRVIDGSDAIHLTFRCAR